MLVGDELHLSLLPLGDFGKADANWCLAAAGDDHEAVAVPHRGRSGLSHKVSIAAEMHEAHGRHLG